MENIFMKQIKSTQDYEDGYEKRKVEFEPDSSPEAWEHYKKVYGEQLVLDKTYNISQPKFFSNIFTKNNSIKGVKGGYHIKEKRYAYIDKEFEHGFNRLYALPSNIEKHTYSNNDYYEATNRLSGEVDFNFNEKHFPHIEWLLCQEQDEDTRERYLEQLEKCKKMHHTLLNFSLMQTVGNMQGFKGALCDDRLDKFLFFLNRYYKTPVEDRDNAVLIKNATEVNKGGLITYLNSFETFENYCEQIYFIDDGNFITSLVESGKKSLDTAQRAMEYIDLANEFWNKKKFKFISKYFPGYDEIYHSLFHDGGETYTFEQLRTEFEIGGIDAEKFQVLLNIFIEEGWLYCCENGYWC